MLVVLPSASGPLNASPHPLVLGLKFLGEETFKFPLVSDVPWGEPEKALL